VFEGNSHVPKFIFSAVALKLPLTLGLEVINLVHSNTPKGEYKEKAQQK
jgi:hypothetical protein